VRTFSISVKELEARRRMSEERHRIIEEIERRELRELLDRRKHS
jgi:hypothetical protein